MPNINWEERFLVLQVDCEKLRQQLEIIALGDSENPIQDAKDILVEIGFWNAEPINMEQPKG